VLSGALLASKPDVLIATSPQFLCAVAGQAVAKLRRVPFVFEVRDLWPESIVAVGALPAGHPVVRGLELIEERLYRQADRIVVVTESFRERLVSRGVPDRKIAVVTNGVDLERFVPAERATKLRSRLGYAADDFVVVYVGTHGMAHGLDTVLDVAGRLRSHPEVRFLLVGEGAERERLQERADREGLKNVRFLGSLPREEIAEVYASSNLCLVPLRKSELFTTVIPSKIFEILGMARPILLAVDGEARRIVEASGGGFFTPPGDAGAMGDAIERLAADRASCDEMGRRGRQYVMENFDRSILADKYLRILGKLV
jgi:glycosyltransferase involved in cell wall biosynthesis